MVNHHQTTTIFGGYVLLFSSIELKQQIQVVPDGWSQIARRNMPWALSNRTRCFHEKTPKVVWFPPTKASKDRSRNHEKQLKQLPRLTLRLVKMSVVFRHVFWLNFQMTKITWNRVFHLGIRTEANGSFYKMSMPMSIPDASCREYLDTYISPWMWPLFISCR